MNFSIGATEQVSRLAAEFGGWKKVSNYKMMSVFLTLLQVLAVIIGNNKPHSFYIIQLLFNNFRVLIITWKHKKRLLNFIRCDGRSVPKNYSSSTIKNLRGVVDPHRANFIRNTVAKFGHFNFLTLENCLTT